MFLEKTVTGHTYEARRLAERSQAPRLSFLSLSRGLDRADAAHFFAADETAARPRRRPRSSASTQLGLVWTVLNTPYIIARSWNALHCVHS
jgi:hypothetical protein